MELKQSREVEEGTVEPETDIMPVVQTRSE